ncbi:hypothetical protein [Enteractinococcus helveticum]|nr:hypothetical protein [Enteractinococcus helveticum]
MTLSTETLNHTPATPEPGRQLHTTDQLLDELNTHFLPGQYVHLETWINPQSSNEPATYSTMEGYMREGDDDFIGIGRIDRGADKPSEQRASIETTGDEGAIMVTVPATGTLVIQDASSPGVTYQLTARTPVFDGPTMTGPLVNDKGRNRRSMLHQCSRFGKTLTLIAAATTTMLIAPSTVTMCSTATVL